MKRAYVTDLIHDMIVQKSRCNHMNIGIDAGGTLIKVVTEDPTGRIFYKVQSSEINTLIDDLNTNHPDANFFLTGGKAQVMADALKGTVIIFEEFDATYEGLKRILKDSNVDLDSFVYLNVGTGTSIHVAEQNKQTRIGGSGVGGGTFLGLSQLLVGKSDFDQLIEMSKAGNRDNIDLKVKHIYGDEEPPISGDFTASNFAYVLNQTDGYTDNDKVQAVIGLVAETVMTIGLTIGASRDIKDVVFIGSTLNNNDVMHEIIHRYGQLLGSNTYIIENGEFSGALGAIYV